MMDGVHSSVCSVLVIGVFVQLHLMASVSHLRCLVGGFTYSWEVAGDDSQGCAGLPVQE